MGHSTGLNDLLCTAVKFVYLLLSHKLTRWKTPLTLIPFMFTNFSLEFSLTPDPLDFGMATDSLMMGHPFLSSSSSSFIFALLLFSFLTIATPCFMASQLSMSINFSGSRISQLKLPSSIGTRTRPLKSCSTNSTGFQCTLALISKSPH